MLGLCCKNRFHHVVKEGGRGGRGAHLMSSRREGREGREKSSSDVVEEGGEGEELT